MDAGIPPVFDGFTCIVPNIFQIGRAYAFIHDPERSSEEGSLFLGGCGRGGSRTSMILPLSQSRKRSGGCWSLPGSSSMRWNRSWKAAVRDNIPVAFHPPVHRVRWGYLALLTVLVIFPEARYPISFKTLRFANSTPSLMSSAALGSRYVAPSGPRAARLASSFSQTSEKTFALSLRIRLQWRGYHSAFRGLSLFFSWWWASRLFTYS